MAVKNRVEIITEVNTKIVPTVTDPILRGLFNDDIVNSAVLRKDVIATETPVAGAVTINYLNKDLALVTTAVNLAVSFTNIENGDVKYLHITKLAVNSISFVGAVDTSPYKAYINTISTIVIYQIFCKNGVIFLNSINIDNSLRGGTITTYLDLPVWNMQTTPQIIIPFTLSVAKIRSLNAIIFMDGMIVANSFYGSVLGRPGGVIGFNNINSIVLTRVAGGYFDDPFFSALPTKRGIVEINHLP